MRGADSDRLAEGAQRNAKREAEGRADRQNNKLERTPRGRAVPPCRPSIPCVLLSHGSALPRPGRAVISADGW